MALSDTEIDRIRYHCGYNLLEAGAELYVGNVHAVFDTVIQTYARTGPSTTSSTVVAAAAAATPSTLTLADGTGFDALERVVVDVDARSEVASVQSRNVNDITLLLTLAHTGTYPVAVFSGEHQIRYLLNKCEELEQRKGSSGTQGAAGLSRVDEVWFNTKSGANSVYKSIADQLMGWRDSLCNALNVVNKWRQLQQSGATVSLY
jgi:hypothetical protein